MEPSDEYLLEMALQGDGASYGQLIRRWERKIFSFICRYIGDREDARDLTQDTFTKAYRNLGSLSDRRRFSAWLYRIALNECRMRFRRQKNIRAVALEESGQEERAVDASTPESRLAAKEEVQLLREVFQDLPEEQRVVILMKEFQGLKFQEISEILDVPLSTAKSRMYLGLKTLKRLMEDRL